MKRRVAQLGPELRRLRTAQGLSLRALAVQAQVSNPYLSQIERGETMPSARILRALAAPLAVTEQHLFALAGLITENSPATDVVIANDEALTKAQREALLTVYRAFVAANNT